MGIQFNLIDWLLLAIGLLGSIIFTIYILRNPDQWELKKHLKKFYWLPGLAPLILCCLWLVSSRAEDMSFATAVNVHEGVLVVQGITETIRERPEDEVPESIYTLKTYFIDKLTGEELFRLTGATACYAVGDKALIQSALEYIIVDIASGKKISSLSENQIKAMVEAKTDKVYSMELNSDVVGFNVRTIMNVSFLFDPINTKTNPQGGTSFMKEGRASFPSFDSKENSLFQPQLVGSSPSGITMVLSYEDLNHDSFILTCFDSEGKLLWQKMDFEIDPSLKGEQFSYEGRTTTTAIDEEAFYFVNKDRIVCLSTKTGATRWVRKL